MLLDVAAGLKQRLSGADIDAVIFDHRIDVGPNWWAQNLAAHGFDNPVVHSSPRWQSRRLSNSIDRSAFR
ncbi:hypothetical protein [Nocardia gipuzkoensis]